SYTALVADATGGGPFTYQWLKNGSPIPGATDRTLGFSPAQPGDGGSYSVTVRNVSGNATSNVATLTVTPFPSFAWRTPTPEGGTLNAVAYANGRFVAVGIGGRVLTSSDGANWTLVALLANANLLGVASDGAQWIAVGGGGVIFTSFDTVNWSQ